MPRQIILPPDEQYSKIETFSANTADTINQVMIHMIGSPPVVGNNKIYGNIYDLSQSLEFNPCILANSFEITKTSNTTINVGLGECFINGVYIKIKSLKSLDTNNSDSYLDAARSYSGIIYIMIKYIPTESDPKAYIGLIKKTTYNGMSNSQKKSYLFLGALSAVYEQSSVTNIEPYYYDPDNDTQTRTSPYGFLDGGWLDLPSEYWHP